MKLSITALLMMAATLVFAQNSTLKHNKVKTVELFKVQGYLEHLPPGYESNPNKKYPLLVFLHGAGERGNSPADMYKAAKNGPPKEVENQGSLCFNVNGKEECFIVISPQLTGGGNWTGYAQKEFWDYILDGPENYRYDPNRIYLTGLSLGGNGVYERAYDVENELNTLAAIAPLCAWGNTSKGDIIAERNIPVWGFHGTADNTIGFNSGLSMFNAINDSPANTQENTFTAIENAAHWIWNKVYKTDNSEYSPNVYQWLLSHTLDNSGGPADPPASNQSPIVDAGADLNAVETTPSVSIMAQASDPDGSIDTYNWKKLSGPAANLLNAQSPNLTVQNLNVGTYKFEIAVTDNLGAQAKDQVQLIVGAGAGNNAPTVDAGNDVNANLSDPVIYLNADASDSDGSIKSFSWKKLSGPSISMWNADRPKLTLVNFITGTYKFEVTVEDNDGAKATDQVQVIVSGNSAGNELPTVSAGEDLTVDVSDQQVFVVAQASDSDGSIASFKWKKVSGPSVSLWNTDRSKLTMVDFVEGTYIIEVLVEDNDGGKATDQVTVTVGNTGSGNNELPTVNAGNDINKPLSNDPIYINAEASDNDGSISSFSWKKLSGPSVSLWNTDRSKLTMVDYQEGTYKLEITVVDNDGGKATDEINVTIGGSGSGNQLPNVNAGADITVSPSDQSVFIVAQASDNDGSIAKFNWKKVSGPSVSLWNTDRAKLTMVDFVEGVYELEITVTDNDGGKSSDRVKVTVGNGGGNNEPLTINKKTSSDGLGYLEYLPAGYDNSKSYPVIIYLHSDNAGGSNLDLIKNEGPMYYLNQGKEICVNGECFIVLSPQIAKGSGFWKGTVDRFYDYVVENYAVDASRIYLTGFDEGGEDALYRLKDDTNSNNRWAAAAAVSYWMPNSLACDIAGSGAALYLANSTADEVNTYSNALSFYNKIDNCNTTVSYFAAESGNQTQSWKNTFDPDVTGLYAWLLNQYASGRSTNARKGATNDAQSSFINNENTIDEAMNNIEKNFMAKTELLTLRASNDLVNIEIKSVNGTTVQQVNSYGDVTLDRLDQGMYLYTIVDQKNNPLQKGRIMKY
ncbi:hypothetical protein E1176_05420 [Fulvivirga sp. RKSG066]|uniref:PKD domain-containing protein n=1 Tax=Fulvivirga aurantia TaxID=2529383 RepID=UPI0012BBFE3E|nr:hypothetical protein [Fulvivirga aurantia]MTI20456.1 hypothetical protein [Fulvivirga aurantia]